MVEGVNFIGSLKDQKDITKSNHWGISGKEGQVQTQELDEKS